MRWWDVLVYEYCGYGVEDDGDNEDSSVEKMMIMMTIWDKDSGGEDDVEDAKHFYKQFQTLNFNNW